MRASAPGKLVLSGAYAILRGAPAIVSAVDRRVFVDTERSPLFEASEVLTLLARVWPERSDRPRVPFADASDLRRDGEKLGLGSSAAITVASLRALRPDFSLEETFTEARLAHRAAQGGGSGIDVLASTFGGTWLVSRDGDSLERRPVVLPRDLIVEVWALPAPAVTSDFVRRVFELEARNPSSFERLFTAQTRASEETAIAVRDGDPTAFVLGLSAQFSALSRLGDEAGVPIVTPEMRVLADELETGSALLPAGAGGGDIVLHVGPAPSSSSFRKEAGRLGLFPLDTTLGAPGVRLEP